jgi:hypothetical protein
VLAVSLEHTTVDLTRCPDAEVADTVILLGHSEDASIKLEEYARWRNELFARELDASVWARTRSLPVVVLSCTRLDPRIRISFGWSRHSGPGLPSSFYRVLSATIQTHLLCFKGKRQRSSI